MNCWAAIIRKLIRAKDGFKMEYTHGWQLMLAVSWELSWGCPQAYCPWPLHQCNLRVVRFLTQQLASPRASASRWQGRSSAFYWPKGSKVTECHFSHILLVKAVRSPPRCKKRGHRPYFLKGVVLKDLSHVLKPPQTWSQMPRGTRYKK